MNKVSSFSVDHTKLKCGIYLSRTDAVGENIAYTYEIRMKVPNKEPVMDTCALHALEHLGATYLRTVQKNVPIVYFGPMGCRTGFNFITSKELGEKERYNLVKSMMEWIKEFHGKIPGASAKECGNYLDLNLDMAKFEADVFYKRLLKFKKENFVYPK